MNIRFLVFLLGGSLVLATAWYFVHKFQVRRHAASLLDCASLAESQERLDRATRFLGLYVNLVPKDIEARVRYGLLLDRSRRTRAAAMNVFEQVLLREPDRHDIRRRLIAHAVELGQYDDALQHLDILMKVQPDDAELEHWRGLCLEARGAYAGAVAQYKRAIGHMPGRIDTYSRCAKLLRDRLRLPGEAENLLNKMVEANKQSFRAYLARAQFRQEPGSSDDALAAAKKDVVEALRLAPDEVETLLAAAEVAQKQPGGLAEARTYLQRLVELHPKDPLTYGALAALESRDGAFDEAIKYLRRGLKELPEHSDMLWNLANLLIQKGELKEARELVAKLGKLDLPAVRVDYLDAAIQFKQGHWREASKKLEAIRPLLAGSREWTAQGDLLLAECYERQGDFDRQLLVHRRVLSLDASQGSARLGVARALVKLGRMEEALEECQRAMALPRPPADGWILWARLLIAQNLRLPSGRKKWEKVDEVLHNSESNDKTGIEQ